MATFIQVKQKGDEGKDKKPQIFPCFLNIEGISRFTILPGTEVIEAIFMGKDNKGQESVIELLISPESLAEKLRAVGAMVPITVKPPVT